MDQVSYEQAMTEPWYKAVMDAHKSVPGIKDLVKFIWHRYSSKNREVSMAKSEASKEDMAYRMCGVSRDGKWSKDDFRNVLVSYWREAETGKWAVLNTLYAVQEINMVEAVIPVEGEGISTDDRLKAAELRDKVCKGLVDNIGRIEALEASLANDDSEAKRLASVSGRRGIGVTPEKMKGMNGRGAH